MPVTPNWEAARNGLPGDMNADNHASQLTQFLGSHNIRAIYTGSPLVQPTNYATGSLTDSQDMTWLTYGNNTDISQPFTMPAGKTTLRRVIIPVNPVGAGADMLVTLHPDTSGSPAINTILAGAYVPASEILAQAAPQGIPSAGPISDPRFNTTYSSAPVSIQPWAYPTAGLTNIQLTSSDQSGSYLVFAGGSSAVSGTPVSQVFTQRYLGGGLLDLPIQQPALPQGTAVGAVSITSNFIVYVGGVTGASWTTPLQNTWVASWDSNTGTIGAWSAQANYPVTVVRPNSAAYGDTVYVVGGLLNASTSRTDVNWATINNGQLTTWNAGPPLPVALASTFVGVIGRWLIVAGGVPTGGGIVNTVYYARINIDNSLGTWNTGPSMPIATMGWSDGMSFAVNNNVFAVVGGNQFGTYGTLATLTFMDNGPSDRWVSSSLYEPNVVNGPGYNIPALFDVGNGNLDLINVYPVQGNYNYNQYIPVPTISVPLPVTGLSASTKYHVVLRQVQDNTTSDYLQFGINKNMLPSDALMSNRYSLSPWTAAQSGYSMPMWVYESSATDTGQLLHLWEDPASTGSTASNNIGASTSTFTWTRFNTPVGLCESTVMPNEPLNANPTFATGVSSWTPHNCTFVQSNAQVHGGFSFSGLMTPNGVASAPNVTSELIRVNIPSAAFGSLAWYMLNGWVYSPTGWGNLSLSVDWYDATSTYISTSNSTTSVSAATWTNLISYYKPPTNAYYLSINMIEAGTPAAGNTLYFSNFTATLTNEQTNTISGTYQINYNTGYAVSGVTQLS